MTFSDINTKKYITHKLKASKEVTLFAMADLNNDGRDEIISIERSSRKTNTGVDSPGKIFYINKTDYSSDIAPTDVIGGFEDILVPSYGERDKPIDVYVSDFDADGLKDIMVAHENGSYFHIFKNNGGTKGADGIIRVSFTCLRISGSFGFSDKHGDDIVRPGDFNGDGLLDFLVWRKGWKQNEWKLFLGTGNISSPFNKTSLTTTIDTSVDCIVTDFDHDGKSDIVAVGGNTVTWYKSNGASFTQEKRITTNNKSYSSRGYTAVGDFDGDGREDLFSYGSNLRSVTTKPNKGFVHGCFNKTYDANLLKIVSDRGFKNTVEISYQPLTYPKTSYGTDFYTKASTAKYPVADVQMPLYAVRAVVANAINGRRTTNYSYARGKVNLTGKGFLGFEEITIEDRTQNRKVKTATENDYAYCLPKKQTVVTSTLDNKVISTVENTFKNTKTDKIYTSVLSKTVETDNLNTLSKTTEYLNYDTQGNLTQSKVTQGSLTIEENTVFAQKGTWAWGANKPVSVTTTHKQTGETAYTRKRSFDYDAKGRVTNDTSDPGDANQVVTQYSNYDIFGHPLTVTSKAKVMNAAGSYADVSRTVTATYTPSGRFRLTGKNELGETTAYAWDEKRGVLNSVTDQYNRKTAYEYDNFGRLKLTVYPDGIKTVNTLQWAGTIPGKPYNATYYSYTETSGQSPVWTWYDNLDRKIRTDSYGLNRKKILVDTEYSVKGQLLRVSEPYFEGVSKTFSATYTYDDYGRVSTVVTPMGTTGYAYSGLTTTVTSPAGTRKTTMNSAGRTVGEETNGKKVAFAHYASGLVKTATPEGNTGAIEMRYDLQGNRTYLKDPDAGIVESRYDGFGQLSWTSQKVHDIDNTTDPVKTVYAYLADGRLNYKETKGKATTRVTYGYDANRRVQTVSQTGHRQTFTYDNLDRATNVKEEIDGISFNRSVSYDALGRIKQERYDRSGYHVNYQYDPSGILYKVTDRDNRDVWELLNENEKRQIVVEKKGLQVTEYKYDKRGFNTSAAFYNLSGLTGISYTYDSKGNLDWKSVTGVSSQQNARYTYDSSNRLTNWEYSSPDYKTVVNGIPNYTTQKHSLTYDATTGNITAKSDLNNHLMKYGENSKPHALTSIAGEPDVFPSVDLTATYTDFKKLQTLKEGNKTYSLTYGVDEQRRKSVYSINNAVEQTKYYAGDYEEETEKNGNIRKIHYLRGAIFIDNSAKADEFYYAYVDHIGSLTALVNESGAVVEHYAYDPWGNRLNPANWRERDTRPALKLTRGYTMHEHIDQFGIINMNGRVYDPLTSQFFSPDPYVQAPGNWVNYNRYAYCMNNPLIYTDPTGEFWFIPIMINAILNLGVQTMSGNINSNGDMFKYAGIGALAGAAGGAAFSRRGFKYSNFIWRSYWQWSIDRSSKRCRRWFYWWCR